MASVLVALLLGGVGSIQVRFPEPHKDWVYTVLVLRDGVLRRDRPVAANRGQVLLEGLPEGRYDVYAMAVGAGARGITAVVRDVAAVPGGAAAGPEIRCRVARAAAPALAPLRKTSL